MNKTAEYIYGQCVAAGMTRAGACALLANVQAESAFRANNLEDTANIRLGMTDEQYTECVNNGSYVNFVRDGFGYGLAQWTLYTRKRMLLNYVRARHGSIDDEQLQVGYMLWEFQNNYVRIFHTLCTSNDLRECTWLVLDEWENPLEKTENMKLRYQYAQEWFQYFKSKGGMRMTKNDAVQKALNTARAELTYHEKSSNAMLDDKAANSGSGNYTKYARDLAEIGDFYNGDKNGFPWCDIWYDWVMVTAFGKETGREMLCQPKYSAGAGCLFSAQYYKQAGRWFTSPEPGDQIFFTYAPGEYSHTGIVEAVVGNNITTIEGNSSDQVIRRNYRVGSSQIIGFGRPRWDLVAEMDADAEPSVPDVTPAPSAPASQTILRKGSRGAEVRSMQEKLLQLGYDIGAYGADGDFGNATRAAVMKFQKDHGLTADGEAGPMTLAALDKAMPAPAQKQDEPAAAPANVKKQSIIDNIKPDYPSVVTMPMSDSDKQPSVIVASDRKVNEAKRDGNSFHIGDIVSFTGKGHYFNQNAKLGFVCKPGKAIVRSVNLSAKHPYKLTAVRGGGSTVNGWVDADTVQAVV